MWTTREAGRPTAKSPKVFSFEISGSLHAIPEAALFRLADIPVLARRMAGVFAAWLRPRPPFAKGRMAEQVFAGAAAKPAVAANDQDNPRLAA